MRTMLRTVMLAACLAAAGCITVDKADPRPGGLAWTEQKAISWLSDLSGNPAGRHAWMFVRVIAPPGAFECWAEKSIFEGVNPYEKAPVDAQRAALVTARNAQDSSEFACRTPQGVVRREIASERIVHRFRNYKNTGWEERSYWAVPPMVHIDPDAQAGARWDALRGELCPAGSKDTTCTDGRLDRMKERDLAG